MSIPTSPVPQASALSPTSRAALLRLWAPLAVLSAGCIRLTVLAAAPIKDPDAWWHLRVGDQYLNGTWTLRDTGPLSVFATETWFPRDWIPQVVAAAFEDWFGLPGVAWLYGAALVVFLVTAYLVCRREADPLPAAVAAMFASLAALASLTQRPQMVSFILMLVVVGAWMATVRDGKPRWWLVPLTYVWACSHGMWYCGIVVGIAVVVGLAVDGRPRGELGRLLAIPLLSLVAAALTPVGPRLLLTVFDTTSMWQFVTEWAPPSFREIHPAAAVVMIFAVVATWARDRSPAPWAHIGLLVVAVGWTLLSARTVALGAVVLAPLVAAVLHGWTSQMVRHRTSRRELGFLAVLGVTCLAALALSVSSTSRVPGDVPNDLDAELAALPAGSPIINDYVLGGWLHWRHPGIQTVVDGFTDGYTPAAISDYVAAQAVEAGWEEYVAQTGAESALLRLNSPLATALVDRLGWEAVGSDEGYVLLRAP